MDTAKAEANAYTDTAVRKAAPRNLLDNSDFTNPVNQRGFVSGREVPAYSYFLDRWVTAGETAYPTFGPEGIGGISNDICQRLDLSAYIGKKMTLALYSDYETVVCFAAGTVTSNDGWAQIAASPNWECSIVSIAANQWSCNFRVPCKYAALYEGEYTADTMPRYSPKGYGPELTECQRYYNRIVCSYANQIVCALTITPGKTVGWGLIPLSQKMRTSPALNAVGSFKCFSGASWTSYQPSEISIRGAAPNTEYFFIQVSLPSELTGGVGAFLQFTDNQSYLEFIADL